MPTISAITFRHACLRRPGARVPAALLSLEVFQQSPKEFYPYDSKFDAVLRGKATLDPQERRGLALFNDETKGNCASCHPSTIREVRSPRSADFGFVAVGVPRNRAIPANRDPHYFDLGLCGPLRTDLRHVASYCGLFRAPSLRNVAVRRTFFHNGSVHTLEDAVRFYAERDVRPRARRWEASAIRLVSAVSSPSATAGVEGSASTMDSASAHDAPKR